MRQTKEKLKKVVNAVNSWYLTEKSCEKIKISKKYFAVASSQSVASSLKARTNVSCEFRD